MTSSDKSRVTSLYRRELVVALALGVFGFVVYSSLSLNAPLWRDEAITAWIIQLPAASDIVAALERDSGAPAIYFLLRAWSALFGLSDSALRLLPITVSSLGLASIYLVGRRMVGDWAAVLGTMWMVVNGSAADSAGQVRMYCLLPALGVLAVCAWGRFILAGRFWPGLAGALACLGLLYSHNIGVVMFAALQIGFLIVWLPQWVRLGLDRGVLMRWVGLQVLVVVGYLPWLPVLMAQVDNDVIPWAAPPTVFSAFLVMLAYLWSVYPFFYLGLAAILLVVPTTLLVLAVPVLSSSPTMRPTRMLLALSLVGFVLAYVASFRGSAFEYRYVSPFLAPLSLAVCGILVELGGRYKVLIAVPVVMLAMQASELAANWGRLSVPSNARFVVQRLQSLAATGDVIVVPWQPSAPLVSHYLPADFGEQLMFPELSRIEVINWSRARGLLADEQASLDFIAALMDRLDAGRTIWVVARREAAGGKVGESNPHLELEDDRERAIIKALENGSGSTARWVDFPEAFRMEYMLLRFSSDASEDDPR